jgi:tRNA (adenine22-N1)-methyltransferase
LAALVPAGARVADVGSDHGWLPLALLASGRARFAVATERTAARALGIRRPPSGAPWGNRFAVRVGDGLAPLHRDDRIETIVLAGLGGRKIARILEGPLPACVSLHCLVLQPRTEAASLRAWLSTRGFRLSAETLVAERGRYHLTLRAIPGDDADLYRDPVLSREDLLAAGPLIVRERAAEAVALWRRECERLAAIVRGSGTTAKARAGWERAARVLARLEAA